MKSVGDRVNLQLGRCLYEHLHGPLERQVLDALRWPLKDRLWTDYFCTLIYGQLWVESADP